MFDGRALLVLWPYSRGDRHGPSSASYRHISNGARVLSVDKPLVLHHGCCQTAMQRFAGGAFSGDLRPGPHGKSTGVAGIGDDPGPICGYTLQAWPWTSSDESRLRIRTIPRLVGGLMASHLNPADAARSKPSRLVLNVVQTCPDLLYVAFLGRDVVMNDDKTFPPGDSRAGESVTSLVRLFPLVALCDTRNFVIWIKLQQRCLALATLLPCHRSSRLRILFLGSHLLLLAEGNCRV